jgi:phage baseplate assembly protein W
MADNGTNKDDFLGRGWSFPPNFNVQMQTVDMTEKNDDIQRSLHILLTTSVGERVMEPKYGCNMEDLLFESLDTSTKTIIKDKILTAILYFEPRITVNSIEISAQDELEGKLLIEIDYVVKATNSRLNFVFPFYKNEGTEVAFLASSKPFVG